jgi:hypothetical protein
MALVLVLKVRLMGTLVMLLAWYPHPTVCGCHLL